MTGPPAPPDDTPPDVPSDTDTAIWRDVTKLRNGEVISVPTKIAITQP